MAAIRIATDYTWIDATIGAEPYAVAWPLNNDPAALTPALAAAVEAAVPGLPVVLIAVDDYGDIRTFGDADRSLQAAKLGLQHKLWHVIDVDVPDDDPPCPVISRPLPAVPPPAGVGAAAVEGCSRWM